jgi:hypothetical protein
LAEGASKAPPAPLDERDPARAVILRTKIRERIGDLRRHLGALRSAMAGFGENFDRDEFAAAFASADPDTLNRVKAVERGVDQLYNYIAELTAFGLELACVRQRDDDLNARRDLDALRQRGVLSRERVERLQQLRELRRLLTHEYARASAEQVHEAAWLVADEFPRFYDAYLKSIAAGFTLPSD